LADAPENNANITHIIVLSVCATEAPHSANDIDMGPSDISSAGNANRALHLIGYGDIPRW